MLCWAATTVCGCGSHIGPLHLVLSHITVCDVSTILWKHHRNKHCSLWSTVHSLQVLLCSHISAILAPDKLSPLLKMKLTSDALKIHLSIISVSFYL
uniref:Uncharacterized protein n=1 Tax=Anguilla anguilla TaxID=7936 RepID=A0A0E9XE38_ANGAN